jgi:hypothetical protein
MNIKLLAIFLILLIGSISGALAYRTILTTSEPINTPSLTPTVKPSDSTLITQTPQPTSQPTITPTTETTPVISDPTIPTSNGTDISWVAIVNQYLNDSMPFPDWKIDPYSLNAYSMFLSENGTDTFVGASNGNDFSAYLLSIISKANKQVNSSIPDSYIDNLIQSGKVLRFHVREMLMFPQGGFRAWYFYFVLDYPVNQDLKGLVFVEHPLNTTHMWESWAITK